MSECLACGEETKYNRLSDLPIEVGYNFQECLTCGVYVNVVDLLSGGYPKGEVNTDWDLLRRDIEKFIHPLSLVEDLRGGKKGLLIDIGCSTGYLLWLARLRGWDSMGIDVKVQASAEARRLFKVDVVVGEFEEVYVSFGKADCFFLNHGIEHSRKPKKLMNKMLHHLSEDGIIYMQHPVMPGDPFEVKQVINPGHQYEWSYPAFQTFLRQFPIRIINTICGTYTGGQVPPSQTWMITHK